MPDDLEHLFLTQTPTADRPLLGLTVLVVEDSRYASEAIRLLCLRSGARIRRADSLQSARRHLSVYRPAVVIVDLGLPDGSGADLIRDLAAATPRVSVILGTSADASGAASSAQAGADGFIEKPIESLTAFQQHILSQLPPSARPRGIRLVADDTITLDPLALRDDLAHISDILTVKTPDRRMLTYVAQFLSGIARLSHDTSLAAATAALQARQKNNQPYGSELALVAGLVHDRLQEELAL